MVRDWMDEPPLPPLLLLVLAFVMVAGVWGAAPRPPVRLALAPGLCDVVKLTVALNKSTGKRNRLMCYYSVAERCSFQSGNSKEGTHWDTSHKPH